MVAPLPPGVVLRGLFVLSATAAVVFGGLGGDVAPAADRPRPNIVFILVDDLGYGDLNCFRSLGLPDDVRPAREDAHYPPTPRIDQLAAQGIRLGQFYAAAPVCSPSRVGVMTGQYPARHLINTFLSDRQSNRAKGMRDYLDPRVPTVARTFQQAGYATAHFGKWHLGGGRDVDDAPLPQAYGFDESLTSFEGLGDRILPPGELSRQSAQLGHGEIEWVEKHQQTGIYVDRTIDFITRHRDQPFYVHLWLDDVHDPHLPAPGEAEKFASRASSPAEQNFFAVLTEMDRQIGRLVDRIDELKLGERTLIVLTSDNGPTAWRRYDREGVDPPGSTAGFRGRKWSLYEGGVRVPLIARWTGRIPAGAVNDSTIVSHLDLFPTFGSLAGIDLTKALDRQGVPSTPSAYFDGLDMSEALLGRQPRRTRPLFWEYGRDETYLQPARPLDRSPNLALREGQWKLLVNADGSRLELYDFSRSLTEFDNVAGQHPEVAARLKERLLTWRRCLPALNPKEEAPDPRFAHSAHSVAYRYTSGQTVPPAAAPAVANAPFTITAEVISDGSDGVIVAHGGAQSGYALYLQDGRLKFTVRIRGQESTFETDPPPVGKLVTIGARLLADGAMRIRLRQDLPQVVMAPGLIPVLPGDGLEVGRDLKSPVGNYQAPFAWSGTIQSVVVEVGQPLPAGPPPTLVTRFAADVDPANPLPEHPRPQFAREQWLSLNGWWEYAVAPGRSIATEVDVRDAAMLAPQKWDGRIVVPFGIESLLSGVRRRVNEQQVLWYRKRFQLPADWDPAAVELNFGAVDWETFVWVNGKAAAEAPHRGGYDPFAYRIGHLLRPGDNELLVRVWDPTDAGAQPRGKQVQDPHGIWYTPVTGIWQSVWLEQVPSPALSRVVITPDVDGQRVRLEIVAGTEQKEPPAVPIHVQAQAEGKVIGEARGTTVDGRLTLEIPLENPRLWSPDDPFLYDLELAVDQPGGDRVRSYFGLRKIAVGRGPDGHLRMLLNGQPLFQFGPLDQGWWPDGLYTAPTDEALRFDVEVTKQFGFNMARKHVKVEPARWYYWCDRLGLLVWQDMPSGMAQGREQHVRPGQAADAVFSEDEKKQFRRELQALIDAHRNAPSIVVWCPFNEGWGQHDTNEILQWVRAYDPTRLVDGPSGWEDRGYGDLKDLHRYPGPDMFPALEDRVSVLGEFGGLGLPIAGHTWVDRNNWGYRTYSSREELHLNYERLIAQLPELIAHGLAAAVYTQTTDVEIEVNGLLTYDRQILKFDPERLRELHRPLYAPPPKRTVLLPTSEASGQEWRYTFAAPAGDDWFRTDFDAASWSTGPGGFGTRITPNTVVRTEWNTPDVWVRREFELTPEQHAWLTSAGKTPRLRLYHDEEAEVYLNGRRVAELSGYVTRYVEVPLEDPHWLVGRNVLAIHCRQTVGGQYIDAGLVVLE